MAAPSLLLLVLVAAAVLLHPSAAQRDDPTPIQQRIALQPGGMTVSWSTIGPIDATPSVVYGLSASNLSLSESGWSSHYVPSISYFHHVVLNGLSPSTRYFWQVTSPKAVNSSVLSFTTAPVTGSAQPFVVAINGDMGLVNEDNTLATMKQWVADDRIDLFWHIGDLAYADDWKELQTTYEQVQETWMNLMTPIYSAKPYMFCQGNHEATCDEETPNICPEGQRNFTSYRHRYRMPARESGAVNNAWYSFDYGQVHFISYDSEVDFPNSPEGPGTPMNGGPFGDQLAWLEADLKKANANRAKVPWILAGGHRPYYSSSADGTWPASRPSFEPLFNQYSVDAVWWGHIHWYERLYPTGANGTVQQESYENPTAPIYIVSGAPGNVEGLTKGNITQPYTAFLDDSDFGLGLLTVHNATHLDWSWYVSKDRSLKDHITIVKTKRWEQLQVDSAVEAEKELEVKAE